MMNIKSIKIRKILNSSGADSYEAEIYLGDNTVGIASAPSAILAGRREKNITGNDYNHDLIKKMEGKCFDQNSLDLFLEKYMDELGTDITLTISLAFARASAETLKTSLVDYIRKVGGFGKLNGHISPMIPIFSGGIHDPRLGGSVQQIMLLVSDLEFGKAIHVIRDIYCEIEQILVENNQYKGLAASSGFLVSSYNINQELDILTNIIKKSEYKDNLLIAMDVAGEHLYKNGIYTFYNKKYVPNEFEQLLCSYTEKYPIKIIEDPFDCSNTDNWFSFHEKMKGKVKIISDDLSATQIKYLDEHVSDGIIIKMKQVGTLSSTLKIMNKAQAMGLKTCVSHRSCETEDTFMCDLAVAANADYMKIGGPRRGDRVEKYNRLIRLYDTKL